jgi:hypothetical protein
VGKQILLIMCLVMALSLAQINMVSAHVLKAENKIGAILHIEPNDNPVTGEPVKILLSFQDVSKKLLLQNCDCFIEYVANGVTVDKQPLVVSLPQDSLNIFTFTEPAVYNLIVTGAPKNGSDFSSFELDFTVRVASGEIQTNGTPPILLAGIAGLAGVLILAAYVSDKKK